MTLFVVNDVSINTLLKNSERPELNIKIELLSSLFVKNLIRICFEKNTCYVSLKEELYYKFTEDLDIGLCFNTDRSELKLPTINDQIILISTNENNQLEFSRLTFIKN